MFKGLITYPDDDDDDDDDNRVTQVGLLDLGNFKIPGQLEIFKRLYKNNNYISLNNRLVIGYL
jgi:hypothetical protein